MDLFPLVRGTGAEETLVGLLVLFCAAQLLLACRRVREARHRLDAPFPGRERHMNLRPGVAVRISPMSSRRPSG